MKHLLPIALATTAAVALAAGLDNKKPGVDIMEKIEQIPDSIYQSISQEDLLINETYLKLAQDGWSQGEIRAVMDNYLSVNKPRVRGTFAYAVYSKEWLPFFGMRGGPDSISEFSEQGSVNNARAAVRAHALATGNDYDNYYDIQMYERRKPGEARDPGFFRASMPNPCSGRTTWAIMDPENPDHIMAHPEGAGISRTDDCGGHWVNITDRIPKRIHRNLIGHSAIPVDPDDWNHVFAFVSSSPNVIYETFDGGETWNLIEGATHYSFKRGYAFKDIAGTLKFIGAEQNGGWASRLWTSSDLGKTWTQIVVPDSMKDVRDDGTKGAWFQEFAFNPKNRDMVYMPTSRQIFYFDDGVNITNDGTTDTYNLKRLYFTVWDPDSANILSAGTQFPYPGRSQAFLNINPNNPLEMWYACGSSAASNNSAIYRSRDGGKNWITLNDPVNGYGSGNIYGNEAPGTWLGGFGVNYKNSQKVYGCSMSSGKSVDGGKTAQNRNWWDNMHHKVNGTWYGVSCAQHNADNHFIASHGSGRVLRGSDAGLLMMDDDIYSDWVNIGSDMGHMLYYQLRCNEFGDQLMVGNTQDINVETYRYGRWGYQVGYEGSNVFVNPYSNETYWSAHGDGLSGLEYSSWWTTDSYPDLFTGNWYVRQNDAYSSVQQISIVRDFGRVAEPLNIMTTTGGTTKAKVNQVSISRSSPNNDASTVWLRTDGNYFRYTQDCFKTVTDPYTITGITNVQAFAADPDDWTKAYVVMRVTDPTVNKVTHYHNEVWYVDLVNKQKLTNLTYDLPKDIECNQFILHEGCGDLYFFNGTYGIYMLPKDSQSWKFWVRGYNSAKSSGLTINYTTQEMVLRDFGRGIWVADLETPCDRYFKNGFSLKEISNIDGRRTIGIDTKMTVPMYYNYEWTVNDQVIDWPYQNLTRKLNEGDRVKLKLTLRESTDVSTTSAEYTVTSTPETHKEVKVGKALYSNGSGRVDLGYVDLFYKDFTIDLWIKPETGTGVILSNGQRTQTRDRRGWWLGLDGGVLKFCYSPANWFVKPFYETSSAQDATLSAGSLPLNQWSHIALTHSQTGTVSIYVNGVKKVESARILQDYTLNNALYLSLFADGYEESTLAATVDELKMWNCKMTDDDVRRIMYSHHCDNPDNLVYYNGFNSDALGDNVETFSRQAPQSRIMAVTESPAATVLVGADYSSQGSVTTAGTSFADGDKKLLTVRRSSTTATTAIDMGVYGYDSDLMSGCSANIATDFYDVMPTGLVVRAFSTYDADNDKVDLTLPTETFPAKDSYKVFAATATDDVTYWKLLGQTSLKDGNQVLEGVLLSDLDGQRVVVAYVDHGIEFIPESSAITNEGYIEIFDEDTFIDFEAVVHGTSTEPVDGYTILTSSNDIAKVEDEVYFKNGIATGQLHIDGTKLSRFGDEVEVVINAKDGTMIPYTLKIINRILPKDVTESIVLKQGAAFIGDATRNSKLSGINSATFMTWVRFDNANAFSGTKAIMAFRNSTQVNGLYLQDGNLRFWWNGSYPFSANTIHSFTSDMVGRWTHIAVVFDGKNRCYRIYMNGKEGYYTRDIPTANISSQLMLGLSNSTDTPWLEAAFDQTMVLNRALTREEVLQYMQTIPKVNDPNIILYANMDYYDADDNLKEVMSNNKITLTGTVDKHQQSTVMLSPTSAVTYNSTNTAQANIWKIPVVSKIITSNRVARFNKYSYNFVSSALETLRPLNKESFTVCWPDYETNTANAAVSYAFTYYDQDVKTGEELTLGIRPLGDTNPYATLIKATPTVDGSVTFTVPYANMKTAIEMMVFTAAPDVPLKVRMGLPSTETRTVQKYVLRDDESSINIKLELLDGVTAIDAPIIIDQKGYATASKETIDPTADNPSFTINIDRDKLNKTGWNPITAHLMSTDCEPLTINVSLTPRVRLYLDDNNVDRIVTATTESLPVKVEWLQGVMEEPLEFDVTTDLNSMLNSATGSLLTNSAAMISGLEFYNTAHDLEDGWNLIGNPFLSNINLTRAINYDTDNTTNFIYHYSPSRRSFIVSERNKFDSEKNIQPFMPFFVQATSGNASFTVTPYARLTSIIKKLMAVDASSTENAVVIELYNAAGELEDETKVIFNSGSAFAASTGEDAPKMWSLDDSVDQIYSLYDGYALAINSVPYRTATIPIGIKVATPGLKTLKVKSLTGRYTSILGYDVANKVGSPLEVGYEYEFDAPEAGTYNKQFEIRATIVTTDADDIALTPVSVKVIDSECLITGLNGDADIRINDMAGRVMVSAHTGAGEYRAHLGTGIYLVTVTQDHKDTVTKIIVK